MGIKQYVDEKLAGCLNLIIKDYIDLGYKLELDLSHNIVIYYTLTIYHNDIEIYTEDVPTEEVNTDGHNLNNKFYSICNQHMRDIKINMLLSDYNG